MSGIVGIVHFDGAPVDRHLLGQMTASMAFRGPDAQEIWTEGNVGFGHALLKTTDESEHERQPFTLDGRIWIVADARVDARHELIPKLKANGHEDLSPGRHRCRVDPARLPGLGRELRRAPAWRLCLRDLGRPAAASFLRPRPPGREAVLSTPTLGQKLIFSSSLDCIRQHPAVSDRLNDLAIADFLLFDLNQDLATTSFADIQRLPPAHAAMWSAAGMRLRRYWTLPIDDPLYFRKIRRLCGPLPRVAGPGSRRPPAHEKVAVMMSGGLDSPTLAATACRIASRPVSRWRSARLYHRDRWHSTATNAITPAWWQSIWESRSTSAIRTENLIDPDWEEAGVRTPEPVLDPTESGLRSPGIPGDGRLQPSLVLRRRPRQRPSARMAALSLRTCCGRDTLAGWRKLRVNWLFGRGAFRSSAGGAAAKGTGVARNPSSLHFLNGSIRILCPGCASRTMGRNPAFMGRAMPASAASRCLPLVPRSAVGPSVCSIATRKRRALLPRSGIHLWTCACSAICWQFRLCPGANKSIWFVSQWKGSFHPRSCGDPKRPRPAILCGTRFGAVAQPL